MNYENDVLSFIHDHLNEAKIYLKNASTYIDVVNTHSVLSVPDDKKNAYHSEEELDPVIEAALSEKEAIKELKEKFFNTHKLLLETQFICQNEIEEYRRKSVYFTTLRKP